MGLFGGLSKVWTLYKPGMKIMGARMKVAGPPGNHVQMQNMANLEISRAPSGLIGKCTAETPSFVKIRFERYDDNNPSLWLKLTHFDTSQDVFIADVSAANLKAIEVEVVKQGR